MAFRAREVWDDNNGNLMLALVFGLVAFGSFAIYWTQVTRVTPYRARFPIPIANNGSELRDCSIKIACDGLQSDISICQIEVYQSPEGFKDRESAVIIAPGKAVKGVAKWEVKELPKGQFAIMAYEDRNGNGMLDYDSKGAPIERYGFSNNPVSEGVTFEEAMIEIEGEVEVQIHLREV